MNLKKKVLVSATALTGALAVTQAVVKADTVTIKAGDTLSQLALDYNTTVEDLVNSNKITDANLIYVGQKLEVGDKGQNKAQAPVQQSQQQTQARPAAQVQTQQQSSQPQAAAPVQQAVQGAEAAAKEWIASVESGGSYNAQNGNYYGRYQLSRSYLNGDYSPANQERVADAYVQSRYGSWSNAKSAWLQKGWY